MWMLDVAPLDLESYELFAAPPQLPSALLPLPGTQLWERDKKATIDSPI